LTGREWLKFTKSWFIHNPPRRSKKEILHPAKFPETMVSGFIEYFTKRGEIVLDPFLGTGSTLVAASETGRKGIGIELTEKWVEIARTRVGEDSNQQVFHGDASAIEKIWAKEKLPPVDFVITSPPYWDMLGKSRGGVKSAQKKRKEKGLSEIYSDDERDLGNISQYEAFIESIGKITDNISKILKEGKYLVIVVQNVRIKGEVKPLAWDLTARVSQSFKFQGEKIWCQDNKKLGIWGYPSVFVPNYHHHYCLIFRK